MKLEIAFTNRFNNKTSMTIEKDGDSSIAFLEASINDFLNLSDFDGYENKYVFLHSLTQEEYDTLWEFLQDMRANDKGE